MGSLLSSTIAAGGPFSPLKLLVQQAANFVDESHQLRRVLLCRGSFAQLLPKLIVLTFQLVGTSGWQRLASTLPQDTECHVGLWVVKIFSANNLLRW
jgi:hypothetical protein